MPIKVLIVDDSLLFREQLGRLMAKDKAIEIVGKAVDAFDAEKKIEELNPDVVTLDVEMPKVNGIDFLKRMIPKRAIPTVVVTATPTSAFEALNAGAVDFVNKPTIKSPADMDAFASKLCSMVKVASVAKVKKTISAIAAAKTLSGSRISPLKGRSTVIAIGASTGGTEALQTVLQELPENTPGIVVVQHMPAGFTKMFSERLNRNCKMSVKEAKSGDRVKQGQVLIAAGGAHMRLRKDADGYYVNCSPGEKVSGHCPSVDALFESVAEHAGKNAIGVILTGMGSDGAEKLKKMRDAGAQTIGQDKESSVVYGMPMVAYNIGAVQTQAPLSKIASIIVEKCE